MAAWDILKYNKVINEGSLVIAKDAPRPDGVKVVLRKNQYDPGRAHLALFNWKKDPGSVRLTSEIF